MKVRTSCRILQTTSILLVVTRASPWTSRVLPAFAARLSHHQRTPRSFYNLQPGTFRRMSSLDPEKMQSEDSAKSDYQYWTVCPDCRGRGKILRPPSRKARLKHRHKIHKGKNHARSQLSPRMEACMKCDKTGIRPSATPPESMASMLPRGVAIVGGGLAGLAVAIALQHRGIPCQVYERDTHFDQRAQGYGLTMQQATKVLAGLGILANATDKLDGGITSTKHVVHRPDGSVVGEWGLRKWGRPSNAPPPRRQNVHIARQALRRRLYEHIQRPDDVICWNHKLLDYEVAPDGVKLRFSVQKETGVEIVERLADVVVGADGIRSETRKLLLDETKYPLRYLGCVVVLGIVPLAALSAEAREHALLDGETVFQTADGSTRIYCMPFSETEYMWQLSFPMEDETQAKMLGLKGPTALQEEAIRLCAPWHDPIPELLQKTPCDLVSGYPVYDRPTLQAEDMVIGSRNLARVTLMGDAAHPMSPFKGQGANQALLDALSFARELSQSLSESTETEARVGNALGLYAREMVERSAIKVAASAEAAKFLHSDVAIQEGNVTRGGAAAAQNRV